MHELLALAGRRSARDRHPQRPAAYDVQNGCLDQHVEVANDLRDAQYRAETREPLEHACADLVGRRGPDCRNGLDNPLGALVVVPPHRRHERGHVGERLPVAWQHDCRIERREPIEGGEILHEAVATPVDRIRVRVEHRIGVIRGRRWSPLNNTDLW